MPTASAHGRYAYHNYEGCDDCCYYCYSCGDYFVYDCDCAGDVP